MRAKRPTTPRRCARLAVTLIAGTVAVLGGGWAAPQVSRAVADGQRAPQVRIKQLGVPGGLTASPGRSTDSPCVSCAAPAVQPATIDAGMRFSMVGVVCDTPDAADEVTVELRTSGDGVSWSSWHESALEQSDQDGQAGESFTDPLWIGAARYVQVRACVGAAGTPIQLARACVVAIGSFACAHSAAAATRCTTPPTAAAGLSLAARDGAGPAEPTIVTRQEWGADESLRRAAPSYAKVKMAFVHHTDTGNDYSQADAPAIVRGIYAYHTQVLGWNDIGYDFLIDRFGTIYEGRYGGVAKGVIGAQVLGFNTGSTGVAIIGTFTQVAPPAAAVSALEHLLAWKLSLGGLNPLGSTQMTCGYTQKFKAGAKVSLPVIAGHRDANYTECPGDALYALLPTVRAAVARLMNPTKWVVTLELSATSVSANSTVTYSGSVKTATGEAGSGTVTVQRRPASGGPWVYWRTARLRADGTYSLAVQMTNSNTWLFRAQMPGVTGILTGYSSSRSLTVKQAGRPAWRVTLGLSKTSAPVGSLVRYSGAAKTASGSPGSGMVTIQRRPVSGGGWLDWRTAALGAGGGYALTVQMTNRNSWQLRARMPGTAVDLVGLSPRRTLTIF